MTAEISANDDWKNADFLCLDPEPQGGSNEDDDNISAEESKGYGANSQNGGRCDYENDRSTLPPWMERHHHFDRRRNPLLVSLHNEILQFYNLMKPRDDEVRERMELVEEISQIVYREFGKEKVEIDLFGSMETGLFLPSSDIDLVVHFVADEDKSREGTGSKKDNATSQDDDSKIDSQKDWKEHIVASSGSRMHRFADAIRRAWYADGKLSYLEVVDGARVPIVKLTHKPTKISIDMSFERRNGKESAVLMNDMLAKIPPLRPLCFVLKAYTAARGINEPYTGGIGSFLLQMMIVSFIQMRCREEFNRGRQASANVENLGSMLLEFLELYGIDFNYVTAGISVRNGGSYFPKGASDRKENFWVPAKPFSLALENPIDITADVGRSTYRIQMIQKSFELSFKVLLAHISEPPEPAVSLLETIIPVTEEMRKRKTLLQTNNTGVKNNGDMAHAKRSKKGIKESSDVEMSSDEDGIYVDVDDESSEGSSRYTSKSRKRSRGGGSRTRRSKKRGRGYNTHDV